MFVINAENVNDALIKGISLIKKKGVATVSRVGQTYEVPEPVTTVFHKPFQRVMLHAERDANPFFHFFESLWMLAGRNDVGFLSEFNSNIHNYSDDGNIFNAPYGYRMRTYLNDARDQFEEVVQLLREQPFSRQAVVQIWSEKDILKETRDKACNLCAVFSIRENKLNMIVYNRSNDIVWGLYGANAVHFSMFQEYIAARLNVEIGTYTHVSNSFHVYVDSASHKVWEKIKDFDIIKYPENFNPYDTLGGITELWPVSLHMKHDEMEDFDTDLRNFFAQYDMYKTIARTGSFKAKSVYFKDLVLPMFITYRTYKLHGIEEAMRIHGSIKAEDWRTAVRIWLAQRHINKQLKKG